MSVIPAADRSWKATVPAELNRSILAMALLINPPSLFNIIAAGLAVDFLVSSCYALPYSQRKPSSLLVGVTLVLPWRHRILHLVKRVVVLVLGAQSSARILIPIQQE